MVKDRKNVSTRIRRCNFLHDVHFSRLFLNKRYAQASVAFQNAGRNRETKICAAYLSREKARLIPTTTRAARTQAFITTANDFIKCARDSPAKRDNERLAYYGIAGECYSEARDLKNAGDSYWMAKQYDTAARTYREGGCFDELAEVIIQHRDALENGLLERLAMVTQMHYFKVYLNGFFDLEYLIPFNPAFKC